MCDWSGTDADANVDDNATSASILQGAGVASEFRFRDGASTWFPYSWLGLWWNNPSEGLLLKFNGDMVYLVLIHGSNLDKPLSEGAINLDTLALKCAV